MDEKYRLFGACPRRPRWDSSAGTRVCPGLVPGRRSQVRRFRMVFQTHGCSPLPFWMHLAGGNAPGTTGARAGRNASAPSQSASWMGPMPGSSDCCPEVLRSPCICASYGYRFTDLPPTRNRPSSGFGPRPLSTTGVPPAIGAGLPVAYINPAGGQLIFVFPHTFSQ